MNITDKDFDFNEFYDSVHNQSGMVSRAMQNIVSAFDSVNEDLRLTDEERKKICSHTTGLDVWSAGKEYAKVSRFIPGNIYLFDYKKSAMNISMATAGKFWDVHPVTMVLRYVPGQFMDGINMNILPSRKRCAVLNMIRNIDPEFYCKDFIESLYKRKKYIFSQRTAYLLPKNISGFLKILNTDSDIDENGWAFRRYICGKSLISNIHLIDFWKWPYIPFLEFSKGVEGVELKKLQINQARKNP